ncbi:hypothetical protein NPIL_477471 [Nephila pilipes]|uniref:Uncharacterized protein n=1 Tax=Nephila pilipes TaxID=299642 RepID=A0A8X6U789_NEPPI|nr:hypothetical protein NPIL_477471 [Nephila pilipes]
MRCRSGRKVPIIKNRRHISRAEFRSRPVQGHSALFACGPFRPQLLTPFARIFVFRRRVSSESLQIHRKLRDVGALNMVAFISLCHKEFIP